MTRRKNAAKPAEEAKADPPSAAAAVPPAALPPISDARPARSSLPAPRPPKESRPIAASSGRATLLAAALITAVALAVRLRNLADPTSVVCVPSRRFIRCLPSSHDSFDEVHFGGFANRYFQHQYYFDVHPPLGKLLLAVAAYLRGYDGSFPFANIGDAFPDTAPYVAMRCAHIFRGVFG